MSFEGLWDYAAWLWFLLFIGSLSWLLSRRSRAYYRHYARIPDFCPSDFVWAVIWCGIYFLLALAAYLVWKDGGWTENALALSVFVVTVLLVHCWYIWVYWFRWLLVAFIWSIVMVAFVIATTVLFFTECVWSGFIVLGFLFFAFFWVFLSHGYYTLNGSVWHVDYRKSCVCGCQCEKCCTAVSSHVMHHAAAHHGGVIGGGGTWHSSSRHIGAQQADGGGEGAGYLPGAGGIDPVSQAAATHEYPVPGFLRLDE